MNNITLNSAPGNKGIDSTEIKTDHGLKRTYTKESSSVWKKLGIRKFFKKKTHVRPPNPDVSVRGQGALNKQKKPAPKLTYLVKKVIAATLPDQLTGADVIKKELNHVNKRCKRLQNELKKCQTNNRPADHAEVLEEEIRGLGETRDILREELREIDAFQNGIASLMSNLRNFYHQRTKDLKIRLENLTIDTPDGPLALKGITLALKDIQVKTIAGKKSIRVSFDIPESRLSIPVEKDEPIKLKAAFKDISFTFNDKITPRLIKYITGTNPARVPLRLAGLLIHFAKKTSIPIASANIEEADIEVLTLNAVQTAGLTKAYSPPDTVREMLGRFLATPLELNIGHLNLKTKNRDDPALAGIQMELLLKSGSFRIRPFSKNKGSISATGWITGRAREVSLNLNDPLKTVTELSHSLKNIRPTAGRLSSLSSEIGRSMSVAAKDLKANVTFQVDKVPAPAEFNMKKNSRVWMAELSPSIKMEGLDVAIKGEGRIETSGYLQKVEFDHSYNDRDQTRKTTVTASNEYPGQDNSFSFSRIGEGEGEGEGEAQTNNRSPVSLKGKVDVTLKGKSTICLQKDMTSANGATILSVEQFPGSKIAVKEATKARIFDHVISLPADMSISADGLRAQIIPGSDTTPAKARAFYNHISCDGRDEKVTYHKVDSSGCVIDGTSYAFDASNGVKLTGPARITHQQYELDGRQVQQLGTDNCGIELADVSLPAGSLKKLNLSIDKNLNGKVLIQGLSLDLDNKLLPGVPVKKIPWHIKFLSKNKKMELSAQYNIKSGKININDILDMKIRLQPDAKARLIDKLTAACVNGILKLFILFTKRNFFKFYADKGHLIAKLPLSRYTIASETIDAFVQAAEIDTKGNINIPPLLQSYTGIALLSESEPGNQ